MRYNLYYNEQRVNNTPLTKQQVAMIMLHNEIGVPNSRKELKRVKTSELKVIRCIVVD